MIGSNGKAKERRRQKNSSERTRRRMEEKSQLNVAVKGNEREEREAATVRIQQGAYIVVRRMKPLSHGAIFNSNSQRGGNPAYLRRTIETSSFFWAFIGDLRSTGKSLPGDPIDHVVCRTMILETRACFAGVCRDTCRDRN